MTGIDRDTLNVDDRFRAVPIQRQLPIELISSLETISLGLTHRRSEIAKMPFAPLTHQDESQSNSRALPQKTR